MLAASPNARAEEKSLAPTRIIALAPNSAETICAIGACDRIVGVGKFCLHPPQLLDRPRVGGLSDPDLERITALHPDLIVMRGGSPSLERLCEDLKVPVYRDETDTLPGIEQCCRNLGKLLGLEDNADRVARDFQSRLNAVRARVAGKPRPRVFLTVSRDPQRLSNVLTAGKGTFLDQMLEAAGGINVFGHLDMSYPQVSPEGIVAQRPEVIIELMPEAKLTPAMNEQLRNQWRQLGSIPTVGNHRLYVLTDDNCLIPSPRFADIVEKVSRLLHPEKDD